MTQRTKARLVVATTLADAKAERIDYADLPTADLPNAGLLRSVTRVLTNDDLLHILATPVTLITPAEGTMILPVHGWAIHDFRGGVYVDPDANGAIVLYEANSVGTWAGPIPIASENFLPHAGARLFYSYLMASLTTNWAMGIDPPGDEPSIFIAGGALSLAKPRAHLSEFTGGDAANTLTLTLYYLVVPTS